MKITVFIPTVLLGIFVSIGCTKNETSSFLHSDATIMDGKGYSLLIANPNNPFDFVGSMHNQILDYVINKTPLDYLNDSIINSLTDSFMDSVYSDYSGQMSNIEYATLIATVDSFVSALTKGTANYSEIISNTYLSSALNTVSYMLIGMINNSLVTPTYFAQSVASYENQILEQNEYSSPSDPVINEHAQTLAALAIARYSYCYWYEVVSNPNNPWYFYTSETKECPIPQIARCIRDVAVSAAADVRGFFGKVQAPADPNNPTQGGIRVDVSVSRAGKASSDKWKSQRSIVYDENGNPYYTN